MKIAIYKDTFANNRGADIAVKNLAVGLGGRGHEVTLFDKTEFSAKVRGDYDVIISTGTNEILDLIEVDGLPPIVLQFHTDPAYPFRHWIKRWRRNRAIKAAFQKVAVFQVLSQSHVGSLQKMLGGISGEKIKVIGNWSKFEDRAPEANWNEKIILCPGAINNDKNQMLLVDAFSKIAEEFPEWHIHIYGKGKAKDEAALMKRIISNKLEGRVMLKGYADLAGSYATCAFVAFPSKTEGFGMVILDAAMFRKPTVMVYDWIGTSAVGGGIVENASVSSFAEGLRRLMEDEELRVSMGKVAMEFCRREYSKEKILSSWESLLSKVSSS